MDRLDENAYTEATSTVRGSLTPMSSQPGSPTALNSGTRRKAAPSPLLLHRKLTFLDTEPRQRAAKKVIKRRASIFGGILGQWKTKGKAVTPNSLDHGEVQRLLKRSSLVNLSPLMGDTPLRSESLSVTNTDDSSYSSLTGWSPAPNSTTFPQTQFVLADAGFSAADPFITPTPPRTPLSPSSEVAPVPESPSSPDSYFGSPQSQKVFRRSMGSGLKTLQILGCEAKDAVAAKYNIPL